MGRRSPLLIGAALLLACGGPSTDTVRREPPNILVLVVDCLRADHLGVNGYHRPTTPNLDRLAAEGANFTLAIAPSHWTRPSVPTILTGLYPSEHGLLRIKTVDGKRQGIALSQEVDTLAERLRAAGYATALIGQQAQLDHKFDLGQGFQHFENRSRGARSTHSEFLSWIEGSKTPRFFAYLHYLEIHWPYCPPEHTRGRFDTGRSDLDLCADPHELRASIRAGMKTLSAEDAEKLRSSYDEELLDLDEQIGEVFAELRTRGVWDETLIVLTSDHGEQFYERGGIGHDSGLFDELIHVPLIIKPPVSWDARTPVTVDALIEVRDLVPTVLEAAGLAGEGLGHSLVPWITDESERAHERAYAISESASLLAVRTDTLKLVLRRDGSRTWLYDLVADPGETTNVAGERPEDRRRLRGYLGEWSRNLRPVEPAERELGRRATRELEALGYLN
jgi:arylsulfatase A-like enzyme